MSKTDFEILVVEDNQDDLDLLLMAIRSHNVSNQIRIARDGVEALDIIFSTGEFSGSKIADGPKLVLLDLNLPGIDGIEVLRRIKSDPETKTIPVIMMTGSEADRDIIDSYRYGTNSYIVKPVDFDKLSETVARLGFHWLLVRES